MLWVTGRAVQPRSATATYAILVAVTANSLTKIVLAWTSGGTELGKLFAGAVAAALAAGAIGLWLAMAL